jgi:hypothetical protein
MFFEVSPDIGARFEGYIVILQYKLILSFTVCC